MWTDYFAHRAPGRRGDKKTPRPEGGGKNVTLMNILRELLSAAKTVEVEKNIYPKKKLKKRSGALQLSALLRQSQHTPAKLFLNNHPAVLKAVRPSLSVCVATSVPLSSGGRCSLDVAVVPLWQRQLLTSGSPSRLRHSLVFFSERPFCPARGDIPGANDDVPFCVLCSCFLCVAAGKKKASEDFYDFSAWMKDLERICITIFITN